VIREREGTRFCSRCGRGTASGAAERVCPICGLGLVLWCAADQPPAPRFAVVGHDMRVLAVSEAGEALFGGEEQAVGAELPARLCSPKLERAVRRAALRLESEGQNVPAGSLDLCVRTCASPRAALVEVVEG
jgi:ribosomal protein S27AE